MEHRPSGDLAWNRSPDDHFTGAVWNTRLHEGEGSPTVIAVQFSPGARSDWHTHPEGQTLYVVWGAGLVQNEGGATVEIEAGDVVHAGPGERHWHGARPDSPMMHLSITSGGPAVWAEKVSDDDYQRR